MALDPSDPPWVKLHWVAQMTELAPRQVARYLGISAAELIEIYSGKRMPALDTRLRIQGFGRSLGIEIDRLEWLDSRQSILSELLPEPRKPAQATSNASRKPRQPKKSV